VYSFAVLRQFFLSCLKCSVLITEAGLLGEEPLVGSESSLGKSAC